jgi:hypothetical protein
MGKIEDIDFEGFVTTAQVNLNKSYEHYNKPGSAVAREFVEIKLQLCIFQYDICVEMVGLMRNRPTGFAVSVALKGMVLRLFEFDLLMKQHLYPRLKALALAREIEVDEAGIKQLKRDWKTEFADLQKWHDVRNQAAGHYGKDFPRQVALLEGLQYDHVVGVMLAFLHYSRGLWMILRDAGRGANTP